MSNAAVAAMCVLSTITAYNSTINSSTIYYIYHIGGSGRGAGFKKYDGNTSHAGIALSYILYLYGTLMIHDINIIIISNLTYYNSTSIVLPSYIASSTSYIVGAS